jgi:hypothetical protein
LECSEPLSWYPGLTGSASCFSSSRRVTAILCKENQMNQINSRVAKAFIVLGVALVFALALPFLAVDALVRTLRKQPYRTPPILHDEEAEKLYAQYFANIEKQMKRP